MKLKFTLLTQDAKLPTRKNPTDAGMDIYSSADVYIDPHSSRKINTGLAIEVPEGYMFLIKPKGSSYHLIGAGVIDAHYEPGEVVVRVVNFTESVMKISKGDPVAQLVLIPIAIPVLEYVTLDELKNNSARSAKGGILEGTSTIAYFNNIKDE